MRLDLAMIVRNCEDTIRPCLLSVVEAIDTFSIVDTGSTDGTLEAIASVVPHDKLNLTTWIDPHREPTRGWISNFAYARNLSFRGCTGDAILWLDADDVLEHKNQSVDPASALRSLVTEFFERKDPAGDFIEMAYDYKRDEYENTLVNVPRYRVVRRGYFDWVWPVHEDLRPLRFVHMVAWNGGDQFILHRKKDKDERSSAERNLWIMERYLHEKQGPMNQRLWSNMAGSYLAVGGLYQAIECYTKALGDASEPEATYLDFMRRGDTWKKLGNLDAARADFARGGLLFPTRRHPYIALAEAAADEGDAAKAIAFAEVAESLQPKEEGFVQMTTALEAVPLYSKARAYMIQGRFGEALSAFQKLMQTFPGAPDLRNHVGMVEQILDRQNRYGAILQASRLVQEPVRSRLLAAAPQDLWTFPEIAQARRPPRPKKKPTLVFYCGAAREPWGPASLKQGIGGSEEAVVLLSQEFAKAGWHVEVYAYPPTDQDTVDEHGVVWMPYGAFNPDEACDVFIGWRQYRHGAAFHSGLNRAAKQSWLWLHDTIIPEHFDASWLGSVDGIFCLSEAHAADMPDAYKHKVHLTTNGLNPDWFQDGPNDARSFIYASSPDRGLLPLLTQWPTIHKALPGSRLHVFYGFNRHYLAAMSESPQLGQVKAQIEHLAKAHGVLWHGMVGQDTLAEAFSHCGFLLYPCIWKETSCITAMKAMAMGAIPITSRYPVSALPETCGAFDLGPVAREGMISESPEWLAEWTAAVIESADGDHSRLRPEMKAWARKTYSWKAVCKSWTALFRKHSSAAAKSNSRPAALPA